MLDTESTLMRHQIWKGGKQIDFYTMPEYEEFVRTTPGADKVRIKYYKVRYFEVVIDLEIITNFR